MKQAANALNWCVGEMERRYKLMSKPGRAQPRRATTSKLAEAAESGEPIGNPFSLTPEAARAAGAAAVRRGRDRRAGRPDDGRRQEARGADRAAGAEGARRGHPPDPGHAAAERRRHHRPDQGQHPDAHRVPGVEQDRQRAPSSTRWAPRRCSGRATCCTCRRAPACRVRVHGAFVSDEEVHRVVDYLQPARASPTTSRASSEGGTLDGDAAAAIGARRCSGDGEADPMYDQAVVDRAAEPPRIDLAGAAPPAHRLQPRRAAAGTNGAMPDSYRRWPATATATSCVPNRATNDTMTLLLGVARAAGAAPVGAHADSGRHCCATSSQNVKTGRADVHADA